MTTELKPIKQPDGWLRIESGRQAIIEGLTEMDPLVKNFPDYIAQIQKVQFVDIFSVCITENGIGIFFNDNSKLWIPLERFNKE